MRGRKKLKTKKKKKTKLINIDMKKESERESEQRRKTDSAWAGRREKQGRCAAQETTANTIIHSQP